MAVRYNGSSGQAQFKKQPRVITIAGDGHPYFRRFREPYYSRESTQLMGFMALLVSSLILLTLAGATVTTTVLGLIFFAPIIIITSPIWVPIGAFIFFTVAGVLSLCGLGLAAAAAVSWLTKYL